MQNELFILMDDSGKLNINENTTVYAGIFFYSSKDYMNFLNKYKSIINSIKCKYCKKASLDNCHNTCPEIKATSKLKPSDRRRIFNLLKKQNCFGVLINNQKVFNSILLDKSSRGRYTDYAQKRIIKKIVEVSILENKINPNILFNLYIKIDEYKTKSNGYYNLRDSINEELTKGISNYDYSTIHKPLINSELNLVVTTYNSKNNYGVQSADMIANYVHRKYQNIKALEFLKVILFLP